MTTPFERTPADGPLREAWRQLAAVLPAPGAHVTEDDWVRFAADELDAAARERTADHIEACAECAATFRALGHLREGAAAIDAGAPAFVPPVDDVDSPAAGRMVDEAPARPRRWWYGLAVGGVLWRLEPSATPEPAPLVADAVPTRPAAPTVSPSPGSTPARATTPAPEAAAPGAVPRAWAELASAPAVMLPASFTIVMRGDANPGRDTFLAAFGPAIAPYREGRYAEAAAALESVTARFPDVDEGWFYLGVSRLHAGRPADAVEPLRRAHRSDVVADQALWFEAVALERAGRGDEATAALAAACAADSRSHAEACATLPAPPR